MTVPDIHNPRRIHDLFIPWLALALTLLALGGFIAYSLYQEQGRIEKRERERLAIQAKVIDENLARQLDGVFRALQGIRKELSLWRGKNGLERANRRLRALSDAMPGIHTFLVVDAGGTIIAANRDQVIGQNIQYREYFQAPLRNPNPSTLYISPPFKSVFGNFVINVGLVIPDQKGGFGGVVSAVLDPEYFKILLDSVLYSPDMWSALAHGDGKLFLRTPEREGLSGLEPARLGSLFTRHIKSGHKATVFTGNVLADGEERIIAQRTISPADLSMDKPLVVAVSRDKLELYADWRRESCGKGSLFAVLVLASILALIFYQRRQLIYEAGSARAVEELRQAKEAADTAYVAKSRFMDMVAHEFRTPLSLLISSTDILDRYGERLTKERRAEQNEHIRSAARQMSSLIDSVLSFNRLEAGRSQNSPMLMDVERTCRVIFEEVKTVWGTGYNFHITINADCGTFMLDEILFRRILENLLTNAFRYTPVGGTVTFSVKRESNRILMEIMDTGIGIPEEDQQRIFDAFYRCPNVEARRGLGLGLSIVREALLQIGGTITLTSRIGEGTTMRVEIPVIDGFIS